MEVLVRHTLDIQEQFSFLAGQGGQLVQGDFACTDREGLPLDVVRRGRGIFGALLAPAGFEQIGELLDSKDALLLLPANDLGCHPTEATQMILLYRFDRTLRPKLATGAMLVQKNRWLLQGRCFPRPSSQRLQRRDECLWIPC